jgi:hypothetical protein
MGQTPIPKAEDNTIKSNVVMTINKDGTILGSSESTVTGFYNGDFRSRESSAQGADDKDRADDRFRNGETGTGEIRTTDPLELSTPFVEKATFTIDAKSNIPGPGAMTIPAGIKLTNFRALVSEKPRDFLRYPATCASKTYEENYLITFPENTEVTRVPANVDFKNTYIRYSASYSLDGNEVKMNRMFQMSIGSSICPDGFNDLRKEAAKVIQRDLRSQIFYD